MRFNITYSDYKNKTMSRSFCSCNLKREVKPELYIPSKSKYDYKNINTHKIFEVDNSVSEYIDVNGITNYKVKIKMSPQNIYSTNKMNKLDKIINNICNTMFINVVDTINVTDTIVDTLDRTDTMDTMDTCGSSNNTNKKFVFMINEHELNSVSIPMLIPELNISLTVYDNYGIHNMIQLYKETRAGN